MARRCRQLLVLLVLSLVARPLVADAAVAGRLLLGLLLLGVLLLGVLALAVEKRNRWVATVLAALVAIASIGTVARPFEQLWPYGSIAVVQALFFAYLAWMLFRFVVRGRAEPHALLMAALCVYLLAAVAWSNAYLALQVFSSEAGASAFSGAPIERAGDDVEAAGRMFVYFSIVTLTTMGYGDITPVSEGARMLASLEAMWGVLYVAIMIASLVGRFGPRRPSDA